MISKTMIMKTMIDETTISEKRNLQSVSSVLRRRYFMVMAWLGLLAVPGIAWAQITLRTSAASDVHCAEEDCATEPLGSAGKAGNQAVTPPAPTEAYQNGPLPNREEAGGNAVPELHREEARANAVPEPPSEFQEFVAGSVGRRLPIYGYRLFDC